MKKINIYVITYNNKENINANIRAFNHTTNYIPKSSGVQFNYVVINNHSNIEIDPHNYAPMLDNGHKFGIFHNSLRPDHSCGHLSRDYNMALIHGFQDLNNPACDQVILLHDDSIWNEGWYEDLTKIHKTYDFYAGDWGDGLTSYLPNAVKQIGLWDERACNIGFHEADYFLRAAIYNRDKYSINDKG